MIGLAIPAIGMRTALPGMDTLPRDTEVMKTYDRLQADDLKQISVIVASFVYEAAMRDQMLPRKPIEKPLPKEPEKKEE